MLDENFVLSLWQFAAFLVNGDTNDLNEHKARLQSIQG